MKNELYEGIAVFVLGLICFVLGYKWRQMEDVPRKAAKQQFSDILTDSEFNTLLDETNYID